MLSKFLVAGFLAVIPFAAHAADAPALKSWRQERTAMATALTAPIAVCVQKHDTDNPAFHGCIDWHSSVHGTWALIAYTWATGDKKYLPLIESLLDKTALEHERKNLAAHPEFEMPYGRAWFLRLAIDYRREFRDGRLDGFASDIAESLVQRYSATPPEPKSIAYQSATWALLNLYDYGALKKDKRILGFVRENVRRYYLSGEPCPLQQVEVDSREFMAVCTNWAWLVSKVLPRAQFKRWVDVFLPETLKLEPIDSPDSVHQSGLNFSRAWGLWNLYRATGEERFLKAYLAHIHATYARADIWNGDYGTMAHWIAQFGMLAIVESYYSDRQ